MKNKFELLPSIMCINWLEAKKDLDVIADKVTYFHWDLVDGNFAPDFTMGSSIINLIREQYPNKGDFHLMIDEPSRLFTSFNLQEGDRVCIHVECSKNLHRDISRLRDMGVSPGVAMSPATPLSTLDYILKDIDRVLLLTVNPGFHSQPLVKQVVDKIKKLSIILEETQKDSVEIVVDGHVNLNTIPKMYQNGAREFVLGKSGLFGKDSKRNLEEIITLLQDLESKQDKLSPITSIGYLS
tara:strand:- start:621 stop:1340 length:720 start_codon:yes stop_codon:yes gene_type:complete